MKRALLVVVVAALSSGCASLRSGKLPDRAALAAVAEKTSKAKAAADEAVKKCPPSDGNIPFEEEKEIGGAIMVGLTQQNGSFLVEGPFPELKTKPADRFAISKNPKNELNSYVSRVGRLLASYSARPELPWVFGVIDNDSVNAFSAPGGYVVVTAGLMRLVENEAQLAGVLGHEIGHVVNKDVIKTYAGVKHTICVPAVTAAAYITYGLGDSLPKEVIAQADFAKEFSKPKLDPKSGGFIDALTGGVLKARNLFGAGKEAEFAADKVGFELMLFAGYDTNEFDKVIRKAEQGGKKFDNHPSNVDRLKYLTTLRKDPAACTDPKADDAADCGQYGAFTFAGVVPKLPDDVKAAVPAEAPKK